MECSYAVFKWVGLVCSYTHTHTYNALIVAVCLCVCEYQINEFFYFIFLFDDDNNNNTCADDDGGGTVDHVIIYFFNSRYKHNFWVPYNERVSATTELLLLLKLMFVDCVADSGAYTSAILQPNTLTFSFTYTSTNKVD